VFWHGLVDLLLTQFVVCADNELRGHSLWRVYSARVAEPTLDELQAKLDPQELASARDAAAGLNLDRASVGNAAPIGTQAASRQLTQFAKLVTAEQRKLLERRQLGHPQRSRTCEEALCR